MQVLVLGTRGVPAAHGGFETFAEHLALFLTQRGHQVTVYCHNEEDRRCYEDWWQGVRRVHISAPKGAVGTILFDLKSVLDSCKRDGVVLTLGYNTAIFSLLYRLRGKRSLMNMDGVEWKREKWSLPQKIWLYMNEWLGARFANHLIADHPEIKQHLVRHTSSDKITVIPYTDIDSSIDECAVERLGLEQKSYLLVIARPEPENSLLEIVQAYSARPRKMPMVILGKYMPDNNAYHREVLEAASNQVRFVGAIYDKGVVRALRKHAAAYIHGHRVGGTNPSLVEALSMGNAIIAQQNPFNLWVAGESSMFFSSSDSLEKIFDALSGSTDQLATMGLASRQRFEQLFTPDKVLAAYEAVLEDVAP